MPTDVNNLIAPLASKRRRDRINANLEDLFSATKTNQMTEDVIMEAAAVASAESGLEILREDAEKAKEKRDALQDVDTVFMANVQEALGDLFGVLVLEALPIDPGTKEQTHQAILEYASSTFQELLEADAIVLTQSPTFKDYAGTVVRFLEHKDSYLTEEEREEILEALFAEHPVDLQNTIVNVYDKAANTVRTESQIKEFRDSAYDSAAITTNSNYVHENFTPTLFRYLNENAVEEVTKKPDVAKLDRRDIMNISLAEALSRYVMLEMLHTTRLANFSADKVRSFIKY